MKLDGGIDTYTFPTKRYLSEFSPKGRKVRYLAQNGWDYDKEKANKFFNKGDILTIEEIYVGQSSSTVEFQEVEGEEFNTTMFEDVVEQ